MRGIVFAICIAAAWQPTAAHAQTLYKCAAKSGNSYRQSPCLGTARTLATIDVAPEPPPTAAQLAQRARKAEQDRVESAFLSHLAGTDQPPAIYGATRRRTSSSRPARRSSSGDGCALAKATRKATLQAVGLDRTYDLLRRLDEEVASACNRP